MSAPQRTSYHVAGSSVLLTHESTDAIAADPRGLLHIFEDPIPNARYIVGVDPTIGVTGWNRASRVAGDHKIDNAAIEVFRVDALRMPLFEDGKPVMDERTKLQKWIYRDLQVAEFFAPIDAVECGRVARVIGKIFCGDAEDDAELIGEFYPGPGMLTLQELLRLNYRNLWHWETIGGGEAEETNLIGWRSWRESQRLLWFRARRHLMERRAKIQSPWLWAEYGNAVVDVATMRAKAAYGVHDDLMQAANMCFWAGHKWTYEVDRPWEGVESQPGVDWQRRAPGFEDIGSGGVRGMWEDLVAGWGE